MASRVVRGGVGWRTGRMSEDDKEVKKGEIKQVAPFKFIGHKIEGENKRRKMNKKRANLRE